MRQLQLAYSRKEKAEKLLSNLEELKEQGSVTDNQYQSLKEEYAKFREDAVAEVQHIKDGLQAEIGDLKKHLETLDHDLANFEARFKVGELPAKNYEKVVQSTRSKIEQANEKINRLQALVDSKSSEDVGGYMEVNMQKRGEGTATITMPGIKNISEIGAAMGATIRDTLRNSPTIDTIKMKTAFAKHKKIYMILGVAILLLIFLPIIHGGCGYIWHKSPSQVVIAAYMAANEGNYSKAEKYISSQLLDVAKGSLGALAGGIKGLWDEATRNGTIQKIEITKEKVRGEEATVYFKVFFKDGKIRDDKEVLIKERGRWRITQG